MKNAPLYDQYCSSFTPKLLKNRSGSYLIKKKRPRIEHFEVSSRKLNRGAIKH